MWRPVEASPFGLHENSVYAIGSDRFYAIDVAIRAADHIDSVFGPDGRQDTSGHEEIELALDTAEQLLKTYTDSDMGTEIEVVANASAIKMLRTNYSPYADRVRELQDRYLNLTFLACKDAMDHVRELEDLKTDVSLLPDVDVTPSALEHILNRLSEGWVYLNV